MHGARVSAQLHQIRRACLLEGGPRVSLTALSLVCALIHFTALILRCLTCNMFRAEESRIIQLISIPL